MPIVRTNSPTSYTQAHEDTEHNCPKTTTSTGLNRMAIPDEPDLPIIYHCLMASSTLHRPRSAQRASLVELWPNYVRSARGHHKYCNYHISQSSGDDAQQGGVNPPDARSFFPAAQAEAYTESADSASPSGPTSYAQLEDTSKTATLDDQLDAEQ